MAGMLFSGDKTFMSFSIGTMMVVAVAMIGSLTVLPALLSKLGDRVEKGRIPFVSRLRSKDGEARVWGAILDRVLRRPLVSPSPQPRAPRARRTGDHAEHGVDGHRRHLASVARAAAEVRQGVPRRQRAGRGRNQGRRRHDPQVQKAIAELKREALATGQMNNPIEVEVSKDKTVAEVDIPLAGKGTDAVSKDALTTLRDEVLPSTVGQVEGVEYAVTGATAADTDWSAAMKKSVPPCSASSCCSRSS